MDRVSPERAVVRMTLGAPPEQRHDALAGEEPLELRVDGRSLLIEVEDDGPGIEHTENLFVPFFTTKPGGSGIGLVLARQIIEAHGGQVGASSGAGRTEIWFRLPALST